MSRKMDWADKEARTLADALGIKGDDRSSRALILVTLKLTFEKGVSAGIDRAHAIVDELDLTSQKG